MQWRRFFFDLQRLEDRIVPSCACAANLFAGPRLVSVDSSKSVLMEGVFNALLPGSHVDLQVARAFLQNVLQLGGSIIVFEHCMM